MSKLEKIDRELEKAREKAAEWQAKIKDLEKQRQEEENSMIVQAVRSLKLTPAELAAFFSNPAITASGQLGPKPEKEKEDGPETEYSNPHPTLIALDAFRFSHYLNNEPALDKAVDFLLDHWTTRKPIGPCHYGIGTLFMQVEYPFRNYNLFQYVYVLSFYDHAKKDCRFLEALDVLKSKTQDGQIVVERVVPKLGKLSFCKKGKPSISATKRYNEILHNLG